MSQDAAHNDAKAELLAIESQIARAMLAKDAAFVERLWANDFVYTGVRGEVKGKQDILAELKKGDLRFTAMRFDDQKVRIYGDVGVVTGRAVVEGESPQGPIVGEFRYTRVYARSDGGWRLTTFQGTAIAK